MAHIRCADHVIDTILLYAVVALILSTALTPGQPVHLHVARQLSEMDHEILELK